MVIHESVIGLLKKQRKFLLEWKLPSYANFVHGSMEGNEKFGKGGHKEVNLISFTTKLHFQSPCFQLVNAKVSISLNILQHNSDFYTDVPNLIDLCICREC